MSKAYKKSKDLIMLASFLKWHRYKYNPYLSSFENLHYYSQTGLKSFKLSFYTKWRQFELIDFR